LGVVFHFLFGVTFGNAVKQFLAFDLLPLDMNIVQILKLGNHGLEICSLLFGTDKLKKHKNRRTNVKMVLLIWQTYRK